MPKPGSRNTLTPKNVTYTRSTSSGVQTVTGTVHTAPERAPAQRPSRQTQELPEGHRFAAFVSDEGKANVQNFIKSNYGPRAANLVFSKNAKFHGIVGPDNKIKAAGEVKRMSWAMSELGHLTVDTASRNAGLGMHMLRQLEQKTETPIAMLTSKNSSVMRMADELGFEKMSAVKGPSGDTIHVYTKTLKPANEE